MTPLSEEPSLELSKFECRRCGACCEQAGFVYLTQSEADRIAGFLGLEPFVFINKSCDLQDRRKLVLRKREDETCIFKEEHGCLIHGAKPQQCLDFPVGWRTPRSYEYCAGLKDAVPGKRSGRTAGA